MRRFIRFMSEEELDKFLKGKPLVNKTVHNGRIKGSFGFCFFDAADIDPITAHHVLSGIATLQYMVEFMVDDDVAKKALTKSKGVYRLPSDPWTKVTSLTEYCTEKYCREDFVPYQIWHLMLNYPVIKATSKETPLKGGATE